MAIGKYNCAHSQLISVNSPKLIPNPKNPNRHPEEQVERLARIIEYQGQRSPIVISNQSGFITKGHGRLLAIQKLGWKECAVDFQDYENDAQEYADIVADNAIAEWSTLDFGNISEEISAYGPELDIEMLGLKEFTIEPADKFEKEDELRDDMNKKYLLEVTFPNDIERLDIYNDLVSRGYIVKIK